SPRVVELFLHDSRGFETGRSATIARTETFCFAQVEVDQVGPSRVARQDIHEERAGVFVIRSGFDELTCKANRCGFVVEWASMKLDQLSRRRRALLFVLRLVPEFDECGRELAGRPGLS